MKRILLSIATALTLGLAMAQTPRFYSTRQGLTSTRINHLMFDRDGFMWISTNMGLTQFNGQTFTHFLADSRRANSLSSNLVQVMYEDREGRHWVGTSEGLHHLCRTENRFERCYLMADTTVAVSVSSIVSHPERPGHILVGTYGYGVFDVDGATRTVDAQASMALSELLPQAYVASLLTDSRGHLWVFSHEGFRVLDIERNDIVDIYYEGALSPAALLNRLTVHSAATDEEGHTVYLGSRTGEIYSCNVSSMDCRRLRCPELQGMDLTALCLDKGTLLVGTENHGLYSLHPAAGGAQPVTYLNCPVDLGSSKIHGIRRDDQGNLWLSLYQRGLLVVPSQDDLFAYHSVALRPGGANLGGVTAFATLADSTRLVAIDGGGLMHYLADGTRRSYTSANSALATNSVLTMATGPDGCAYVGTYGAGVYCFRPATGPVRDTAMAALDRLPIMSLCCRDSVLYAGTNGSGVWRYDLTRRHMERLRSLDPDSTFNSWTYSIHADGRGAVWTSTAGGFYRVDATTGAAQAVRLDDGRSPRIYAFCEQDTLLWMASDLGLLRMELPAAGATPCLRSVPNREAQEGEELLSVMTVGSGEATQVWFATSYGIGCYMPASRRFISYRNDEIALAGNFCSDAMGRWTTDAYSGHIVVGGDNGVIDFDPRAVAGRNPRLKDIFFTRLWIDNSPVVYDPARGSVADEEDGNVLDAALWAATTVTLPPSAGSFSLAFAVQEYCNPFSILYAYRLAGYEEEWHDVHGSEVAATYVHLPAGEYDLQVRACTTENRNITTFKQIHIVVLAPWYRTWWFRLLCGVAVVGLLVLARLQWVRHTRRRGQTQG